MTSCSNYNKITSCSLQKSKSLQNNTTTTRTIQFEITGNTTLYFLYVQNILFESMPLHTRCSKCS